MDDFGIARIAALIGDRTRAQILITLMDDRALPAGELAALTNVSPATMSAHLSKMINGGLLIVEPQGKHRYYRLSGPKVASLVEAFSTVAPLPSTAARTTGTAALAMRFARTCYNHLAGQLAVELNLAAQRAGLWIPMPMKKYKLTTKGTEWLAELGLEPNVTFQRNEFARACLDWTERKYHIAGTLGALLMRRFLELRWIAKVDGSRSVRLTQKGREELSKRMKIRLRAI